MADSKVLFTVAEDRKLVEKISKLPCIYDLSSPLYKDLVLKDNVWRETAEFCDRSVEDVKKRWKNIKDTYHKRQKKIESAGHRRGKGKKWILADKLTFLNKVDYKRECACNVGINHTNEATAEIPQKPSTSHTRSQNLLDRSPKRKARPHEEVNKVKTSELLQNALTSHTPSQNLVDRPPKRKARTQEEDNEVKTSELLQNALTLHTPSQNSGDRPLKRKAHTHEDHNIVKTAEILQNALTSHTPQNSGDRPLKRKTRTLEEDNVEKTSELLQNALISHTPSQNSGDKPLKRKAHTHEDDNIVKTAEILQNALTSHITSQNFVNRPPKRKARTHEEDNIVKTAEMFQNTTTSYTPSQNMEDRSLRIKARPSNRIMDLLESREIEREMPLKILAEEKLDDDVDLFFKSIACSVKKLRPDFINEAKIRSLQMVIELENRNKYAFNFPPGSSTPSTDCD